MNASERETARSWAAWVKACRIACRDPGNYEDWLKAHPDPDLPSRLRAAQLRGNARPEDTGAGGLLDQAAGRLEELEAENERLRAQGAMGALIDANAGLIARAERVEAALRDIGDWAALHRDDRDISVLRGIIDKCEGGPKE